jgi:hypothetical protein
MSVYISGVEMPKEHPLYITLRPDGSVYVWASYNGESYGTQAIPVPEHGDLIDRDALPWENQGFMLTDPNEWGLKATDIENAPTIIPAEDNTDFFTKGHLHLGRVEGEEG